VKKLNLSAFRMKKKGLETKSRGKNQVFATKDQAGNSWQTHEGRQDWVGNGQVVGIRL